MDFAVRLNRAAFAFVLMVVYVLVAAATFHGYYSKWQMSDDITPQSIISIIDGTADRPYVHRQLLPIVANEINRALPERIRHTIEARLTNADGALKQPSGAGAKKEGYVLRYRIVYYLTFLCLFLSLFVLRSICLSCGLNQASATAAPAVFALMVPILQTRGGYFYDFPEILAFSLAARFALSSQVIPLLLLSVPATVNKETFFFFCLSLPPLLMRRLSVFRALAAAGIATFISGLTYLHVRSVYADNSGTNIVFQFFEHLSFYANPLNLLAVEQTYGLPLFKGYGIIVFCWLAVLVAYGWREVPRFIRTHLALAAVINLPLFFLFAAEGEMRNLSMLYVATVVTIAGGLQRWFSSSISGPKQG